MDAKTGITALDLTKEGVEYLASVEQSLADAMTGLTKVAGIFPEAYRIGAINGGDALKMRDEAIALSGETAALHSRVIAFHEKGTAFAQTAGADVPVAYAELPEREGGTTRSGGR